jgi:mRNA-degrading endonuclease RelE of RelBE toxin-antitoxin system
VKKIVWSEHASKDIRRLDREVARRVFGVLDRLTNSGLGDLKRLKGQGEELRLRVGDWRIRLTEEPGGILRIHSVRHRSEAYR